MADFIRLATHADAPQILELTHRAYESIRQLGLGFPAASADLEMVKNNIQRNRCYVSLVDHVICSTVSVAEATTVRTVIDYPFDLPFIWWFATDPIYEKKGIGGRLLDEVEATILRELHARAVTLSTSARHPWLVEMYQRRGYEKVYESHRGSSVILKKNLF
ncbi:GNAT family N-acetyltransferase [Paenibacillus illinoisensis]|uniref:GNAT family N-acetyltransferase n=1 Tax=Paenibacillus illinoisensis TaxID=59845 RepID=UPI003D27913C